MELMGAPERTVAPGRAGLDVLLAQREADAARVAEMAGIVYDARTERRSWQAMRDLFDELLA